MTTQQTVALTPETVLGRLQTAKWWTAGQITEDLRQCGPLAFQSDAECQEFHLKSAHQQYQTVYTILLRLRKQGRIDLALGDNRGREVRVFKLFA